MNSANSPGNHNREKYLHAQANRQEDSRYSSRYPHEQRHFSTDTAEHSRYSTSHLYTKNRTPTNLNAEENLPYSSYYSYRRRYNDVDPVNMSNPPRYSGTDMSRHTFELERNERSRLESHSRLYPHTERCSTKVNAIDDSTYSSHFSHSERNELSRPDTYSSSYSHTERYTPGEVNEIGDRTYSSHFSHWDRNERSGIDTRSSHYPCTERYTSTELNTMDNMNEYSRSQTFGDSTILSRKCMSTNLNKGDDLEYFPGYPNRGQNVPTDLGRDRDYTRILHRKMSFEADDVGDPTYRQEENFAGMGIRNYMPYAAKGSAFVPLSHRDRSPPELNIPDDQLLRNPHSGKYMSIDEDANIVSRNNNKPTSQSPEWRQIDEVDVKACSTTSKKKKFTCEICDKKFHFIHQLQMHMGDKHKINVINQKVVWKEGGKDLLLQMRRDAVADQRRRKRDAKLELMQMELKAKSCESELPSSKRKKCELCNKSVKTMHLHMRGVHNPKLKFKCDICHKTFPKEYQLKIHKKGKGTNKCLPKRMRAKLVSSKSLGFPASSSSYKKDIPTEVSAVENPPASAGSLQTKGEVPAEIKNSGDPSDISAEEIGTAAAGNSTESHSPASNSTTLHENLPIELGVAEESRDLSLLHKKDIQTEESEVKNPPASTGDLQTVGEVPTDLQKSGDPTEISTKEVVTSAAENSTASHPSHTGRYIPIELDAVIASSSRARDVVGSIVGRPVLPPLQCEYCNEKFQRKSYLTHHNKIKHGVYRPKFKFSCPYCIKKFRKLVGMKRHITDKHRGSSKDQSKNKK